MKEDLLFNMQYANFYQQISENGNENSKNPARKKSKIISKTAKFIEVYKEAAFKFYNGEICTTCIFLEHQTSFKIYTT